MTAHVNLNFAAMNIGQEIVINKFYNKNSNTLKR